MNTKTDKSFRRALIAALAGYGQNPRPIQFEGKSEPYVRATVSGFNTSNNTSYSVIKHGNGLLVGLRSDCRNYSQQPVQQQPSQPEAVLLSGSEHLRLAVEMLRGEGLGGDDMRAQLNELLNDNDDLV